MICRKVSKFKIPIIKNFNQNKKINLLNFDRSQMRLFFKNLKEEPFRADQVMRWIYHRYCDNFDNMTDINKILRKKLKKIATISAPEIMREQYSSDGTVKWLIAADDQYIETVYIPKNDCATLCISSQAGCVLKCKFCSTAQQGFNRNLNVSEIIGQVWRATKITNLNKINVNKPITNVVMMGMGEPLLNLNNVVSAIKIMLDDFGFGFSKRHVILSTSGIAPAINKLSSMIDVALAVSLHAPNDIIRNEIMPINKKYDIKTFLVAVRYYLSKSKANHKGLTVEYIMLDHVNDSTENAHELAKLLKNIPCKINLIPWNHFPGALYNCSSNSRINRFSSILIGYGFRTIIRKSRGSDINAACGQLVGNIVDRTKRSIKK